jgi:hypothetical protein
MHTPAPRPLELRPEHAANSRAEVKFVPSTEYPVPEVFSMPIKLSTILVVGILVFTHSELRAQKPLPANPTAVAPASSAPAPDRIQQMRADLNQMESLMNNMTSEINFLRDQNLQILLNTNVRMWTILIRDLRLQLDEEEQRRELESKPPQPKPSKP